jgi:hypothetical protein
MRRHSCRHCYHGWLPVAYIPPNAAGRLLNAHIIYQTGHRKRRFLPVEAARGTDPRPGNNAPIYNLS